MACDRCSSSRSRTRVAVEDESATDLALATKGLVTKRGAPCHRVVGSARWSLRGFLEPVVVRAWFAASPMPC